MVDYIVFRVGSNKYALDIENVERIIQSCEATKIPNAHKYIDGMISYEGSVLKILSFRKIIGLASFEEELRTLFVKLKNAHHDWVDTLRASIVERHPFTKTTDPHKCELGMWIDSFNSYDEKVSSLLKHLSQDHKRLHIFGGEIIEHCEIVSHVSCIDEFEKQISPIFSTTMGSLDVFVDELDRVAHSLQKLIIFHKGSTIFAIKVDEIEDIAHVNEHEIMRSEGEVIKEDVLSLGGILDIHGVLINVIKEIKLPKKG